MLMALDEVTQICPVPLPLWMADSAGKGILIVAVCHGLAQLQARWDSAGAHAIWDTAGIKVVLGGVTDPDTLDSLSRLCGEVSLRSRTRTISEDGRRGYTITYKPVRILPPELVRELPDWRALIIRGGTCPRSSSDCEWHGGDATTAAFAALVLRSRGQGPFAPKFSPNCHHLWTSWPMIRFLLATSKFSIPVRRDKSQPPTMALRRRTVARCLGHPPITRPRRARRPLSPGPALTLHRRHADPGNRPPIRESAARDQSA
jgi:hypothetical protein